MLNLSEFTSDPFISLLGLGSSPNKVCSDFIQQSTLKLSKFDDNKLRSSLSVQGFSGPFYLSVSLDANQHVMRLLSVIFVRRVGLKRILFVCLFEK